MLKVKVSQKNKLINYEVIMKIALTVKELAALLGVSIDTVYRMARENHIPHVRAGSRILFHRETIENWLKGGSQADGK